MRIIADNTNDRVRWPHLIGPFLTMLAMLFMGVVAIVNQDRFLLVVCSLVFLAALGTQMIWLRRMRQQRCHDSTHPPSGP